MESKLNITDNISTLSEQESLWYTEVSKYLYKDDVTKDDKDVWRDTLVGQYRKYNQASQNFDKNQPGAFLINDIWLSIPPQSMQIYMNERHIDIPQLRSNHSVKLSTGYGEMSVKLNIAFTDNTLSGRTLEDEVTYKLIPLLTQIRHMPFVHVKNKYLTEKLIENISNTEKDNDIEDDDFDIILTYVTHHISQDPESPRIIHLTIDFLLFNYLPYMKSVKYVTDYDRTHRKNLIDRSGGLITNPSKKYVNQPYNSFPFYEFHAKEFQRTETIMDGNFYHQPDSENIEFTYYTYYELDRGLLDESYNEKIEESKKKLRDTEYLSTTQTFDMPCSGHITSRFGQWEEFRSGPHKGIDIGAPVGTPVFATYDGNVIATDYDADGYGNYVKINIGNGQIVYYGHLSSKNVYGGQTVKKGDLIGRVGSTGRSTGPHLHYGLLKNGKWVDPLNQKVDRFEDSQNLTDLINTVNHTGISNKELGILKVNLKPSTKTFLESNQLDTTAIQDATYDKSTPHSPVVENKTKTTSSDSSKKTKSYATKEDVTAFLESLEDGTWDIILRSDSDKSVYIRLTNKYNPFIHLNDGIDIVSIENVGGHDVPRIPISGYRYATHQYMGGHVEKISINIITTNENGDSIFKDMQRIFNIVSNNAIKNQRIAALDGIGIKNKFINSIAASEWFILDDISINTHPEIPNGSVISISMTDNSRVKEYTQKAFRFGMDSRKNEDSLYKQIYQELLTIAHVRLAVHQDQIVNDGYNNPLGVSFIPKQRKSKRLLFAIMNPNNIDARLANIMMGFVEGLNKIDYVKKQYDIYSIRGLIDSNQKYPDMDKYIYDYINEQNTNYDLTNYLRSFAKKHYKELLIFLPKTYNMYPDDVIEEFDQISTPAYLDFNLPASIDPDYYFYQPDKYYYSDYKQEIIDKKLEEIADKISSRISKYQKQLKITPFGSNQLQTTEDNLIYQLVGSDSDYFSKLKFADENPNLVATNLLKEFDVSQFENEDGKSILSKEFKDIYKVQHKANLEDSSSIINESMGLKDLVIKYIEDESTAEKVFQAAVTNHHAKQKRFDILKCFPVVKIYIIEEDDQEGLAPIRRDLNELYGLNAIERLKFIEHNDQPTDLLMVSFVDLTGKFTSARFKDKPFTETKNKALRDTNLENSFDGIMLKEGTRIQFRAGYSNNINNLITKFNGHITSIGSNLNQHELIAQSYGSELITDRKSVEEPTEITSFNAETKEILNWALTQPEVKHFGRWKLSSIDNLQFSGDTSGLNLWWWNTGLGPGSYVRKRPDGKVQRVWSWKKNYADLNILAPEEPNDEGWRQTIEGFIDNPWSIATDIFRSIGFELFDYAFSDYYVWNNTLWDVINEMTYRYPGYIAKVLPFGDRSTLYYGPPDGFYYYRPFSFAEGSNVASLDDFADELSKASKYDKVWQHLSTHNSAYYHGPIVNNTKTYEAAEGAVSMAQDFIRAKTVKPFRSYWTATSENNIIKNNIKADYRNVYNTVEVSYSPPNNNNKKSIEDVISQNWVEDTVNVYLNDFIKDEEIRKKTITNSYNCVNPSGAYKYGIQELWKENKNLYKGTLNIIGEPEMKPYDYIYIFDDHTQTYGPIEVQEHIISISPGEGMISTVTPGMVSHISDLVGMSTLDAFWEFIAKDRASDMLEFATSGVGPVVMGAVATGSAIAGVAAIAGAAPLSVMGIAVALGTSVLAGETALKLIHLGQYRNAIELTPLIRGGVPYIVGMNTYKTGGMLAWAEDKWNHVTEGLEVFGEGVSTAVSDFIENV